MKKINNKRVVLCDSMIWYYIKDQVVEFDKTNFEYYGTAINIGDFLGSDKLESSSTRKNELKAAIDSLDQNSEDVICIDPMTAAASNLLGIKIDDEEQKQYQNVYNILIGIANGETPGVYGPGVEAMIIQKEKFRNAAISSKKQFNKLFREKKYPKAKQESIIERNIANWLLDNFNDL